VPASTWLERSAGPRQPGFNADAETEPLQSAGREFVGGIQVEVVRARDPERGRHVRGGVGHRVDVTPGRAQCEVAPRITQMQVGLPLGERRTEVQSLRPADDR
jgi:hypothetical protein